MIFKLKNKALAFLFPINSLKNAKVSNSTYPIDDDLFGLNTEQKEVCFFVFNLKKCNFFVSISII